MIPRERADINILMIRLADGDRTAFDSIYEAVWPLVHRFAKKITANKTDSEDIAQHALMKVFSRASEFRRDGDALSWILGITAYECKTVRQKTRRRKEQFQEHNDFDKKSEPSRSAEELLIANSLASAIKEVLAGLSEEDQETIRIAINDLSRPDIPAATFRKRLERSFDRLRKTWRERYE